MEHDATLDALFMTALSRVGAGGITPLLHAFFGALRRHTDMFRPPGGLPQLQSLVSGVVSTHYQLAAAAEKSKPSSSGSGVSGGGGGVKPKAKTTGEGSAATTRRDAVASSVSAPAPTLAATAPLGTTEASNAVSAAVDVPATLVPSVSTTLPESATDTIAPSPAVADAPVGTTPSPTAASGTVAAGSGAPVPTAGMKPIGNGGVTDRYAWTQTLQDVTITFDLPPGTRSRDLVVDIKAKNIQVSAKGSTAPLLSGALPRKVRVADSTWMLDAETTKDKVQLTVVLAKDNTMEWWTSVAEGEPAIDVSLIEPENSKLNDLDADTRTTVEKMMFDQRQKARGLPTADELQRQTMIEKFMKAHPELDFSKAKIG